MLIHSACGIEHERPAEPLDRSRFGGHDFKVKTYRPMILRTSLRRTNECIGSLGEGTKSNFW